MGIESLLRRLVPDRGRAEDQSLEAVRAALDTFRKEVRALRKDIAAAHRQIHRTEQHVEQLLALRREDAQAGERLDRLAPVMDFDAGARHAREAIAQAHRADVPLPHLVIAPLVPSGIYAALLEAIPPPVFFARGRSGFDELHIPPDLAPLHASATWTFFERLVRRAITPALVSAFADPLGERLAASASSESYLVRREAGDGERGVAPAREAVLRLVLHLAPEGPANGDGSRLQVHSSEGVIMVPFQANTAVAFLEERRQGVPGDTVAPGAHNYVPFPVDAQAGDVRYSYELAITARSGRV